MASLASLLPPCPQWPSGCCPTSPPGLPLQGAVTEQALSAHDAPLRSVCCSQLWQFLQGHGRRQPAGGSRFVCQKGGHSHTRSSMNKSPSIYSSPRDIRNTQSRLSAPPSSHLKLRLKSHLSSHAHADLALRHRRGRKASRTVKAPCKMNITMTGHFTHQAQLKAPCLQIKDVFACQAHSKAPW